MTVFEPRPHDSLAPLSTAMASVSGDHARLEVIAPPAIINLRGRVADSGFVAAVARVCGGAPPEAPNCWVAAGGGSLIWLGPDEWLWMDGARNAADMQTALREANPDDPWFSVSDLSHNLVGLRLSGPMAREVLACGCALDLSDRAFGADRCAQTILARTRALIRRNDIVDLGDGFEIWVRNSFARYTVEWICDTINLCA